MAYLDPKKVDLLPHNHHWEDRKEGPTEELRIY